MKNKTLIILISIVSLTIIILLGVRFNSSTAIKKLKADISYPTVNGFSISCDANTLNIDDETICTLVGHYDGGINGIEGILSPSSGLDIVRITPNTGFLDLNALLSENERNPLAISYASATTPSDYVIATVQIKATALGSNTLGFTGDIEHNNKVNISDSSDNVALVDGTSIAINVSNESSSGGEGGDSQLSSINTLESLIVSNAILSPAFDRTIYSYTAVVPNDISNITINGERTDPNSTVTGFGAFDLVVGENPFEIDVKAQNNETSTYTIVITRQAAIDPTKSSDNTLKGLSVEGATLSPIFSSTTTEYTMTVENNVTRVNVIAETNDNKATVVVTGNENLAEGENTVTIKVTAEDNSVKTYTIIVTRKSSGKDPSCVLQITSTAYKVDNTNQIIDLVNQDDSVETIRKNLSISCGSISVTNDDKVIISNGVDVKTYTIKRVFIPKTGQNAIKYVAIILGIALIIGVLIFVKKKIDK